MINNEVDTSTDFYTSDIREAWVEHFLDVYTKYYNNLIQLYKPKTPDKLEELRAVALGRTKNEIGLLRQKATAVADSWNEAQPVRDYLFSIMMDIPKIDFEHKESLGPVHRDQARRIYRKFEELSVFCNMNETDIFARLEEEAGVKPVGYADAESNKFVHTKNKE